MKHACYVMENSTSLLDLTEDEAEMLVDAGLLVKDEEYDGLYNTTALVWNDLNLTGEAALNLIEAALAGWRKP